MKNASLKVIYQLSQIHFGRPQEHSFRKSQLPGLSTQNKWAREIQCEWKELLNEKESIPTKDSNIVDQQEGRLWC